MKKIILSVVFMLCTVALVALDAQIVEVTGTVEIGRNGSWRPATKGSTVSVGETISTGFKSQVLLKIDGSNLVVKQLTRLTVQEILQRNNTVASEVFLDTGSLKADINPATTNKVEFKVNTPVATASVLGTQGEIGADGSLVGTRGQWLYVSESGVMYVLAGDEVVYVPDGALIRADEVLTEASTPIEPPNVPDMAGVEASFLLENDKFADIEIGRIGW